MGEKEWKIVGKKERKSEMRRRRGRERGGEGREEREEEEGRYTGNGDGREEVGGSYRWGRRKDETKGKRKKAKDGRGETKVRRGSR